MARLVSESQILIASRNGYGKRSRIEDYSVIGRGGQGVIGMKLSDRNGDVVGAVQVFPGDEVILISDQGTLVRIPADEVSVQGRNTQGVRLINLGKGEHLVGMASVEEGDVDTDDGEEGDEGNTAETASAEGTASDETASDNTGSEGDTDEP